MFVEKEIQGKKWFNSENAITNLMIANILVIIICSQSFAIGGEFTLTLFGSIINHNTWYLLVLIYFIILKFRFGKRYFNYLNVFLIFIYFIATITSCLTMVQAFSFNSILSFVINSLILLYSTHTLLRDTKLWREFHLARSPFNEINNETMFYIVTFVAVGLLAVNLISTVVISGVVISVLDTCYFIFLARYFYLYREYLDKREIDSNNDGNFDAVRDKVQEVLDKTDLDEKIVEVSQNVKDKIENFIENDIVDSKNGEKAEKSLKKEKVTHAKSQDSKKKGESK